MKDELALLIFSTEPTALACRYVPYGLWELWYICANGLCCFVLDEPIRQLFKD